VNRGDSIGSKAAAIVAMEKAGLIVPITEVVHAREVSLNSASDIGSRFTSRGITELAVRSSGVDEDGLEESKAGLYRSILNVRANATEILHAVTECIDAAVNSPFANAEGLTVVIQEMVTPDISGLMFTEDPLLDDSGPMIEWIDGHLESLVSGNVAGRTYYLNGAVEKDESVRLPSQVEQQLLRDLAMLESIAGGPADVEWAAVNGRVIYLQVRPITHHYHGLSSPIVDLSKPSAYDSLPEHAVRSDKIAFRRVCASLNAPIAWGWLVSPGSVSEHDALSGLHHLESDYIAVCVLPTRIDGNIQRIVYRGNEQNHIVDFCMGLLKHSSNPLVLIKRLQPTEFTGISHLEDGTGIVEIADGHFVSKGASAPWEYTVERGVVRRVLAPQHNSAVRIIDGSARSYETNVSAPKDDWLADALPVLSRLHDALPDEYLEFGFQPDGELFLIDHFRSAPTTGLPDQVVSAGQHEGTLVMVHHEGVDSALNTHFHDTHQSAEHQRDVIFVCERPTLDLVGLLPEDGLRVAFLFRGGSRLCHLAVLLRERKIPAMFVGGVFDELKPGAFMRMDTNDQSLVPLTTSE
jgi:hypothetical protein